MNNLYLNTKQIMFFILPMLFMLFLYSSPKSSVEMIDSTVDFISAEISYKKEYSKLTEESIKKKYYKSIDTLQTNYLSYEKSLVEINKPLSFWIIAYSFKYVNIPKSNKEMKLAGSKGIMGKVDKLQKMVDKRNNDIQATLVSSSNSDIDAIKRLIKNRNLTTLSEANNMISVIDPKRYNLQMIYLANGKSEVIINNKIYRLNQYIDKQIKITKIKDNKILLTNKKEKRWLKLIK